MVGLLGKQKERGGDGKQHGAKAEEARGGGCQRPARWPQAEGTTLIVRRQGPGQPLNLEKLQTQLPKSSFKRPRMTNHSFFKLKKVYRENKYKTDIFIAFFSLVLLPASSM